MDSKGVLCVKQLCLSSYGPRGKSKIVHINPKSYSVKTTSISTRIFSHLNVKDPIVDLLMKLVADVRTSCGDSGLYAMQIAAGLIERGWKSNIPIATVIEVSRMNQ